MLANWWRLRFVNQTGESMIWNDGARIAIRVMEWKMVAGVLTRGVVITENMGFIAGETILDDGEVETAVVDNTGAANRWWGAHGTFEITHQLAAAAGVCRLYLEFSDNNGNWPSDTDDFVITDLIQVAVLPIDNSGVDKSRSVNFVL